MNKPRWADPASRRTVWIGFDPREATAFAVARYSLEQRTGGPIKARGLVLDHLRAMGIYTRPHSVKDCRGWCPISQAPISTEFANSRFLVPHLAESGWAVFMDCDMLVRTDIKKLFDQCDNSKAIMCVKHHFDPPEGIKMDGQLQTRYFRKNWSSVMAFNCDHPANKALTLEAVNTWAGRDLHAFKWLDDDLIGELDQSWNFLVGHTEPEIEPDIVHFTEGGPWFAEYQNVPYADEWRAEMLRWAV